MVLDNAFATSMTEERFWEIVDKSKQESNGKQALQVNALEKELYKFSESELIEFENEGKIISMEYG